MRGQRTTYIFHPGAQQPVTHTWEVWYAKELGSDVRIVDHNPDHKAGDQQTDLLDIKYVEPEPSVFSPTRGLFKSSGSIILQLMKLDDCPKLESQRHWSEGS